MGPTPISDLVLGQDGVRAKAKALEDRCHGLLDQINTSHVGGGGEDDGP